MTKEEVKSGSSLQLGRVKVGEQIGEGGFGVVHKATLEGIDLVFAIKFFHPAFGAGGDDAVRRFRREALGAFQAAAPAYRSSTNGCP
jgi:serine/threonine protein kinase